MRKPRAHIPSDLRATETGRAIRNCRALGQGILPRRLLNRLHPRMILARVASNVLSLDDMPRLRFAVRENRVFKVGKHVCPA